MKDVDEIQNVSVEGREEIARKIGQILTSEVSLSDRKAAEEIAKALVEDVALSVRELLSLELSKCTFLPQDIIQVIVNDIEHVSIPFIIASNAISDDLLEAIIHNSREPYQEAVARRYALSEAVSFAVANFGSKKAIVSLIDNEAAELSRRSFERVIDRFPTEYGLMEKLAGRGDLPMEVVERIIFKVSRQYGEYLVDNFNLSVDYTSYLVSLANRQVFSRMLEMSPMPEIENYLKQLHSVKSLGSDLLLNYLQNGHLRLFTATLAHLCSLPYEDVEEKLGYEDKKILVHLLEKAHFSKSVIGVLLIAYERLMDA